MPTLPATVKYSDIGYSYSVEPNVVRSEFSTRNTRQRVINKKRDDVFSVQFDLSQSQFLAWENFVQNDISNGADLFTAPFYTSDIEQTGSFYLIGGTYSASHVGNGSWNVQCNLELKGRTLDDEQDIYEVIESIGTFEGASALFDALEDMINFNNL